MAAPDAARTWGRVRRAKNKCTVLNMTETILYGFGEGESERQQNVDDGDAVRSNPLILENERSKGVGNLAGTTLLAINLAHNSDCDHRFGGLSPVSRAKANSMIPLI